MNDTNIFEDYFDEDINYDIFKREKKEQIYSWKQKNGKTILLTDMYIQHLQNTINMLERKLKDVKNIKLIIKKMKKEIKRRVK